MEPEELIEQETEQKAEPSVDKAAEEKAAQEKAAYDKQQQMIDQERANARRARERADEVARENERLKSDMAGTKEQIEKLKEQIEGLNRPKLDPDVADIPDVAKYAKTLEEQLTALKQQQAEIKRSQDKLAEQRKTDEAERELQRKQEMILKDCDDEFGAQFRNEALDLAKSLIDKGDEKLPSTDYEGAKLMRKCYKQIASSKKTKTKATPSDTGSSTVTSPELGKPGTLEEVLADMKKTKSWRARAG